MATAFGVFGVVAEDVHVILRDERGDVLDEADAIVDDDSERAMFGFAQLRDEAVARAQGGADVVAGARGFYELEPVFGWFLAALADDLDHVAGSEFGVEGDERAVYACAVCLVAEVGMDGVGEIDWRRAGGEIDDFTARGDGKDAMLEEIDLHRFEEFFRSAVGGVARDPFLPFAELANPGEITRHFFGGDAAAFVFLFIEPVRRDAEFARVVHVARADLEFDDMFAGADDARVQTAVRVRFGQRDVVFDAAGERRPRFVDNAEDGVAFGHAFDDDAHRDEVVDFADVHVVFQ